jgi:glycosyltransferase involved in cell wall biosynthesis
MHILQINTTDIGGGAEKVAYELFRAYRLQGHDSRLAVGYRRSADEGIVAVAQPEKKTFVQNFLREISSRLSRIEDGYRGVWRLRHSIDVLADGWPGVQKEFGYEDFHFPAWRGFFRSLQPFPDVIHLHNLHGGYFDLRLLPMLSRQCPLFITLHDAWLLSGHCAHSFDCERWRIGCGQCPDLSIYPAIRRDATARNWRRKQSIYHRARLYVATPSHWLMKKVSQSMLSSAIVESRVIPNGVDLSVFRPQDKRKVRASLGIPHDARVLLFVANGVRRNMWKGYEVLRAVVACVAQRLAPSRVLFMALGDSAANESVGEAQIRFVPYQSDPRVVAAFYQAADVYVHAARAENFPTTVMEALACGTPVVATAIGGIPEQISDGETGFLTPPQDAIMMTNRIIELLTNQELHKRMQEEASAVARRRFDLSHQVNTYLTWYQHVLHGSNEPEVGRRVLAHALSNPD